MKRTLATALLATLTLTACGKRHHSEAPTPVPAESAEAEAALQAEREAQERMRREAEEARLRDERTRRDDVLAEMIFFRFDSFELAPEARSTLDAKLSVLRADPSLVLRLEGHADDQGSSEYNLALGMRRANAAREYLAGYGIAPVRLRVTSYGEERPLVEGTSEDARAQNRRVEFRVSGGDRRAGNP